MKLGLEKKIPASLRNEFWTSLMLAVEDEILVMRTEIEKKKVIFSTSVAEVDRLKELGDLVYELDYDFLSSIETLLTESYGIDHALVTEFIRAELTKVPFQVQNKALLLLYKSFFNFFNFSLKNKISVYLTTDTFDIFTKNTILIRDLVSDILVGLEQSFDTYGFSDDDDQTLTDSSFILGFNRPYSSFYEQNVTGNFIGRTPSVPILDSDDNFTLDGSELTILDATELDLRITTRHISLEVVADQLFRRKDADGITREYLFTADAASYLYSGIYFNKKASEVPHIGMQMTIFVDKTGFSNFLTPSLSVLGTKAVLNPSVLAEGIDDTSRISNIQFGTGAHIMPEYSDITPTYMTELDKPIYSKRPYVSEKYSNSLFMGAIAEYIGQAIGGFTFVNLDFGAGSTSFTDVSITDERISSIVPGTLKMMFIDTTEEDPLASVMKISDDGYGSLVSEYCKGKIDYLTGKLNFETSYVKKYRQTYDAVDSGDRLLAAYDKNIISGTYQLILRVPQPGGGFILNYINDDGNGTLSSTYDKFVSGSITYGVSSTVDINFSEPVSFIDSIVLYDYDFDAGLTSDHKLYLHEMYINDTVRITEAGLFVRTVANPDIDQLLAYVTFPAMEFAYNYYHLNLGIIFER